MQKNLSLKIVFFFLFYPTLNLCPAQMMVNLRETVTPQGYSILSSKTLLSLWALLLNFSP